MRSLHVFLLAYALCWVTLPIHLSASVIGIDLGTAWFKVGSAKKFEVVLNKQSKRKTETLVHLGQDQLYFGPQAIAMSTKFPKNSFPNLKTLLGKPLNSSTVQSYFQRYGHDYVPEHERSTVHFKLFETEQYSVEELVAMILSQAKKQAEDHIGMKVSGAVITIPPYFNQFERQAVLDAAAIAKLKVISLIHDTTAVGLYFGAKSTFDTPEKHIFYDMGAGSTVVALMSFSKKKDSKKLQVNHVAYDADLGGQWIDRLMFDLLERKFREQHQDPGFDAHAHPSARHLLMKEATRLKEMFSLNTELHVKIDHLHAGRDLNLRLLRDEFEAVLQPHKERVIAPLQQVLASDPALIGETGTLGSLVLVGGSTRIPLVQAWIAELVGAARIATSVNTDEAATLGATLYAAKLSSGYRVTRIDVEETLPYTVRMGKGELFRAHLDGFPAAKAVTLKKGAMEGVQLFTRDDALLATLGFGLLNESTTQIHVKLAMDANGVLTVANATQLVETSSFFGGKSNTTNPLDYTWSTPHPPMLSTAIAAAREKLLAWREKENAIRYRSKVLNDLQSLVYELRSHMEDDDLVLRLSTEQERSKVMVVRNEAMDWLEVHEDTATLDQIQAQLTALKEAARTVMARKEQWVQGVASLHAYADELNDPALNTWVMDMEAKQVYDLAGLQSKVSEVHAKVLEKREQERIQKEKERQAKEAEEAKKREKLMEELKKKLEKSRLEKEKAAAAAAATTAAGNATNETTVNAPANTTESEEQPNATTEETPEEKDTPPLQKEVPKAEELPDVEPDVEEEGPREDL